MSEQRSVEEDFERLAEAFAIIGTALQAHIRALGEEIAAALAGPPKPPATGPAPKRSKNPKHH
jgi:hypothetical protein